MILIKPLNFSELLSAARGDMHFDTEFEGRPDAAGTLFMLPGAAVCPGPLLVRLADPSHNWPGFVRFGESIPVGDFRNLNSFRVWATFDDHDPNLIGLLDAIAEGGGSPERFMKREVLLGAAARDLWLYRGKVTSDRLSVEPQTLAAHAAWDIAFKIACVTEDDVHDKD